jgi:hypothetical protein
MYQGKYCKQSSSYVCGLKRYFGEETDTPVHGGETGCLSICCTLQLFVKPRRSTNSTTLSPFQNNSFKCCILQNSLSSIRGSSTLRTSFRRLLTAERSEIESNAGEWQMEIATYTYTTKPPTASQKKCVKFTNQITLHGGSSYRAPTGIGGGEWIAYRPGPWASGGFFVVLFSISM